jgi:CheY-like chemotaxis protein
MRILVIDDDAFFVKLMSHALQKNGHVVEFSLDGLAGARHFEDKRFDAVVCDLVMPEQDGIETIREIRFASPDVAIVAISGGTPSGENASSNETVSFNKLTSAHWLGADVTLKKPFSMSALVSAVEEAVQKQWTKTAACFG